MEGTTITSHVSKTRGRDLGPAMLTQQQLSEFLAVLNSKRAATEATMSLAKRHALADLTQEATGELSHVRLHPADLGADAAEQETELVITGLEAATLAQVDEALKRLREGCYGVCECCGQDIAIERLKAIPETAYCLNCEMDREDATASKNPQFIDGYIDHAAYISGEDDTAERFTKAESQGRNLEEASNIPSP